MRIIAFLCSVLLTISVLASDPAQPTPSGNSWDSLPTLEMVDLSKPGVVKDAEQLPIAEDRGGFGMMAGMKPSAIERLHGANAPSQRSKFTFDPEYFFAKTIEWSVTVLFVFPIVYQIARRSTSVQFTRATSVTGFLITLFVSTFSIYVFGMGFYKDNPAAPLLVSVIVSAFVIAALHLLKRNSGPSEHGSAG